MLGGEHSRAAARAGPEDRGSCRREALEVWLLMSWSRVGAVGRTRETRVSS